MSSLHLEVHLPPTGTPLDRSWRKGTELTFYSSSQSPTGTCSWHGGVAELRSWTGMPARWAGQRDAAFVAQPGPYGPGYKLARSSGPRALHVS